MQPIEIHPTASRYGLAGIVEDGGFEKLLRVPSILRGPIDRVTIAEAIVRERPQVMASQIGHQEERHALAVAGDGRGRPQSEVDHPVAMQNRKVLLCRTVEALKRQRTAGVAIVVQRSADKGAVPAEARA